MAATLFQDAVAFVPERYRLLPFRFERLDRDRVVLTNLVGEFVVVSHRELRALVDGTYSPQESGYRILKERHFIVDDRSSVAIDLLALKAKTRVERVAEFTGLHMFVVTLRCEHSCPYCQVSRQTSDKRRFDMSVEHADKALAHVFRSPSKALKIEFQGGEPLLNFELIEHIVTRAEAINASEKRQLQFVVASNLAVLTDDMISFAETHNLFFSTSLDGPPDLHNANRPRPGRNSYELAIEGIKRIRAALGTERVSALMTTTPASLGRAKAIVDEYLAQGFSSIFLRPVSPYGFAVRSALAEAYSLQQWLDFYFEGLEYIIDLNLRGVPFREDYASIVLQKMLRPYGTTYVDLQSPAGLGISAIAYNYDGAIYASDEARMLAEMKDDGLRLGHLDTHSWEDVFTSDKLLDVLSTTLLEVVPQCCDCAFLPYCGSDPTYHRATQGDFIGHKARSGFCERNTAIFKRLIGLLEERPAVADVLKSWV